MISQQNMIVEHFSYGLQVATQLKNSEGGKKGGKKNKFLYIYCFDLVLETEILPLP